MNDLRTPLRSPYDTDGEDRASHRPDEECVELALLVPGWQCAALERSANSQGLTIGQLLRQLIVVYLAERNDGWHSAQKSVRDAVC